MNNVPDENYVLQKVVEYRDTKHAENVQKIKAGVKCIFTVPVIFLILLFLTDSSRIIFLVLWITSLFIIAAYLIHVEYSDYKIQEMVNSLQDDTNDIDSLIDIDTLYSKVTAPRQRLELLLNNIKPADVESPDEPQTENGDGSETETTDEIQADNVDEAPAETTDEVQSDTTVSVVTTTDIIDDTTDQKTNNSVGEINNNNGENMSDKEVNENEEHMESIPH